MKPISDIRRANLAVLVAQTGGTKAVADKLGKDPNQVDQWLMDPKRTAARNIGHASARLIEKTFGKLPGWLDHAQDVQAVTQIGPSQSLRIEPDTLLRAIRFMQKEAALHGAEFDPVRDVVLFAGAIEIEMKEKAGLPLGDLLDFGEALRKRMAEKAGENDKGRPEAADS